MDRRNVLALAAGAGVAALAGCTGGTAPGSGGTRITDRTVETPGTECLSGRERTDVEFRTDAGQVVVTGVVEAPDPCHDATLRAATYDPGADRLSVDVGVSSRETACPDCVGAVSYRATITFEGDLPREVEVSHRGTPLASGARASAGGGNGAGDGTDGTATVAGTDFAVEDVSSALSEAGAEVRFDADAGTVTVDGTIEGSDGCTTAALEDVAYDAGADTLAVAVVTERRAGADTACTQQLVAIDYRATVTFDGGLPGTVEVSHDGRGVTSAARETAGGS